MGVVVAHKLFLGSRVSAAHLQGGERHRYLARFLLVRWEVHISNVSQEIGVISKSYFAGRTHSLLQRGNPPRSSLVFINYKSVAENILT